MMTASMLVLFTDFGIGSPYMGQMRAVLHQGAPGSPIIELFADAPAFDARAAAYLLAAHAPEFPPGTVFVCVVDPGVGGDRPPMVLRAKDQVFVGPGNGLFEIIAGGRLGSRPGPSPGARNACRRHFMAATCSLL